MCRLLMSPVECGMETQVNDSLARWQARLEDRVRAISEDASHDLHHVRRVWRLSQQIAAGERLTADLLVLMAAAYMHDIVNPPKDSPLRSQASRLSAERATEWLAQLAFPGDKIPAVAHAIEAHSFSAGVCPRTIEAEILQDADRMEALGAIGLARVFYVAGRLGSALFDPEDPRGERRELDDRRFAVDHFALKLLRLPERMNTRTGRRLAGERGAFLRRYVDQLLLELEG
jgi:uncharacterized protein